MALFVKQLLDAFAAIVPSCSTHPISQGTLAAVEPLNPREHRVLQVVSARLTNLEITEALVVSLNTVKTHLKRIYAKFGVQPGQVGGKSLPVNLVVI